MDERLRRREVLSGLSASQWSKVDKIISATGTIFIAVVLVVGAIAWPTGNSPLVVAGVGLAGLGIAAQTWALLNTVSGSKEEKEFAAGYSTFRYLHLELDLVEPRSGCVIRSAGEPQLSDAEYRRRLELARRIGNSARA